MGPRHLGSGALLQKPLWACLLRGFLPSTRPGRKGPGTMASRQHSHSHAPGPEAAAQDERCHEDSAAMGRGEPLGAGGGGPECRYVLFPPSMLL